jgi:hypothetical protein
LNEIFIRHWSRIDEVHTVVRPKPSDM